MLTALLTLNKRKYRKMPNLVSFVWCINLAICTLASAAIVLVAIVLCGNVAATLHSVGNATGTLVTFIIFALICWGCYKLWRAYMKLATKAADTLLPPMPKGSGNGGL